MDVGATFLIVALGKRSPMPYVWLPRGGAGFVPERRGRSEHCGVPQEWWKCLTRRNPRLGRIAQLVEQLTLNQRVPGSSPGAPTIDLARLFVFLHQNIPGQLGA